MQSSVIRGRKPIAKLHVASGGVRALSVLLKDPRSCKYSSLRLTTEPFNLGMVAAWFLLGLLKSEKHTGRCLRQQRKYRTEDVPDFPIKDDDGALNVFRGHV